MLDVQLTDIMSVLSHPLSITIIGLIGGWILRLLYDAYILNLTHNQRIAQGTIDRVLGFTERHYFPLCSRGFQMVSALDAAARTKKTELRADYTKMALYRLAQYLATERRMTKESGGLLLMRDHEAERNIVRLKLETEKLLPFKLSDREWLAEIGELDFSAFERKLSDKRLKSIYRGMETWLKEPAKTESFSKYVICENEVITQALGNVYRPWYGKKPPPISEDSKKIIKELATDC